MSSTAAVRPLSAVLLLVLLLLFPFALTKYEDDDRVTLWVHKLGPYLNPQEAFDYYSFPFCPKASNNTKKSQRLGDVLGGYVLMDSQLDISFKRNVENTFACEMRLDADMVRQFKNAIDKQYFFEFFIDDLPLWGFLGDVWSYSESSRDKKYQLYTHKNLIITYNTDQIIGVNLTQSSPKVIEEGSRLNMTYYVKWIPTQSSYAQRFSVYQDNHFFDRQTHWSSLSNTLLLVIMLIGSVSIILIRTLADDDNKDADGVADLETTERVVSEKSRWKLVHSDVFRPPQNLLLLSALVGTGAQLTLVILLTIILTMRGMLYVGRGALSTTVLFCYVVTSIISGYVSGGMYSRCGGGSWMRAMISTILLFPFMCFTIGSILNSVVSFGGSLVVVPLETALVVFAIWALLSFPLAAVGTIVGRHWNGVPNDPCATNKIPRPVPHPKWYFAPNILCLWIGFLSFGSIVVELSFLFASFWKYKLYYSYDVLLVFFIILILVTICGSIVGTYHMLNSENYHWQWTSFMLSASVSIYVYLYSIHYYFTKTSMYGLFQTSYYFACSLIFSVTLGLVCGATGYLGSSLFVQRIYRNVKCD